MLRLERRIDVPGYLNWAVPIGSLFAALVAGSVLMMASGNEPISTYGRIVSRAFTDDGALTGTIIAATPLLFTGLAAAVAFRMGLFNIGGEGQFLMGAIGASGVALTIGPSVGVAGIPLMIAAAAICGGLWALIVGVLKAYFKTNEIITSLMLNYVAANIATYLIFNAETLWRLLEGSGKVFPQGKPIDESLEWPTLNLGFAEFPFGYLVGAVIAVGVWALYTKTRFGFEVKIVSESAEVGNYAGMKTKRKILSVMGLSGALAGIGGASDVGSFRHILDPKGLGQSGYGYAGIVVAALARLNPIAVVFVSVLMGGLANAGRALQGPGFPAGLVGTLQGMILFFALGGEILLRYRVRRVISLPEVVAS